MNTSADNSAAISNPISNETYSNSSSDNVAAPAENKSTRKSIPSNEPLSNYSHDGYQSSVEPSESDDYGDFTRYDDFRVTEYEETQSDNRNGLNEEHSIRTDRDFPIVEKDAADSQIKTKSILSGPFVNAFKRVFKRSRSISPKKESIKEKKSKGTVKLDLANIVADVVKSDFMAVKKSEITTEDKPVRAVEGLVIGLHGNYLEATAEPQSLDSKLRRLSKSQSCLGDDQLTTGKIRRISVSSYNGSEMLVSNGIRSQTLSPNHDFNTDSSPWISYRCQRKISGEVSPSVTPNLLELQSLNSLNSNSSFKSQLNRQTAFNSESFANTIDHPFHADENYTSEGIEYIDPIDSRIPRLCIESNIDNDTEYTGLADTEGMRRVSSEQSLADSLFFSTSTLKEESDQSKLSATLKDAQRQHSLRDLPSLLRILSRRRNSKIESIPKSLSLENDKSGDKKSLISQSASSVKAELSTSKSLHQPALSSTKPTKQTTIPTFIFGSRNEILEDAKASSEQSTDNEVFSSLDDGKHGAPSASLLSNSKTLEASQSCRRRNSFFSYQRKRRSSSCDSSTMRSERGSDAASPENKDETNDANDSENQHPVPPRRSKFKDIGSKLKKEEALAASDESTSIDVSPTVVKCNMSFGNKLGRVAGVSLSCSTSIRSNILYTCISV